MRPVPTIQLRELWKRLKVYGDAGAHEQLVVAYSPLVKYVAGRVGAGLPPHIREADLISWGLVGLLQAVDRYDPNEDAKFETFAAIRIKFAMLDELRASDWVPKRVRAEARKIERAHAKMERVLQRAPTDEELSQEVGISLAEFQDLLLEVANSTLLGLDSPVGDPREGNTLATILEDPDAEDPLEQSVDSDVRDRLAAAITRLPEREGVVLRLYYYENLMLREIGEVLAVTESRVCQLHAKAIIRLRSAGLDEGIATRSLAPRSPRSL